MSEQDRCDNAVPLRENLVQTAVQFLQNPKIVFSPVEQKQEFLKKKGLTDEEIKTAFKLVSVDTTVNLTTSYNQPPYTAIQIPQRVNYSNQTFYQITFLQKIKEIFSITALIGATVYAIYWFYKKFVKSLLFGQDKKKSIEDAVIEVNTCIDNNVKPVSKHVSEISKDIYSLRQQDQTILSTLEMLKGDVISIKAILLSSKQFPDAPSSIPPWQRGTTNQDQEKTTEREDDAGSGSNNSDSSLEMIREEPVKE